jgi:hypothetical protein
MTDLLQIQNELTTKIVALYDETIPKIASPATVQELVDVNVTLVTPLFAPAAWQIMATDCSTAIGAKDQLQARAFASARIDEFVTELWKVVDSQRAKYAEYLANANKNRN